MEKSSSTTPVRHQLTIARAASSGRSVHTVYGGHEHTLRQTLDAIEDSAVLLTVSTPALHEVSR